MSTQKQTYLQACLRAERSALDLAMSQLKETQEEVKRLLKKPGGSDIHDKAHAACDIFERLRAAVGTFPTLEEYLGMSGEDRQSSVENMFASARGEEWEVVSHDSN